MRGYILVLWFFFFVHTSEAQTVLPDSVELYLNQFSRDTTSVIRLNTIANNYLNSNPAVSRKIASHTATLSKQLGFTRGYARSLTVLGNSYWYEGLFEFAENYYLLAARQYEEIKDNNGLGKVYNNIGEVNKALGLYDAALDYLKKSTELRQADSTLGVTLYNIAELYILKKQFDEATQWLQLSIEYADRYQDERSAYYNYWSRGKIKIAKGQFTEGIVDYNRAIAGWKSMGEQRALIQTYLDMVEALRKNGDLKQSSIYIGEVQKHLRQLPMADLRLDTYLQLSKLDSALGNYSQSLYNLTRYNSLKDSLYNLLKTEQVARLQVLYEADRRERENNALRNERRIQQNELQSREQLIGVVAFAFVILAIFAILLYRQRLQILRKNTILFAKNEEIRIQKESLEIQAVTLIKLNEELNNLNKNLEVRIEERSTQLMIQNQKLAEYSFVNAHKLRAPVASILGLIELLNQATPIEQEQIVNHLKTCTEQLDAVIQEIGRNLES